MFESLTNQKLIAAYKKAIDLKLDADFIKLLEKELQDRNVSIASEHSLNKG
ncbi:sporulation histidine kinase inhibitor Sda [Aquibacillus koreensis]|uniref:Sporulation histidine kinase inhibitor Sda n=1 Tax=Aquibacillus koreensis TaxID=279446 RepID=A0A9X3WL93_9BACI|nr:sporulation histidine kinase inhibitor Sda [Aquibacillus koreensis]MCT2534468.1 sporulation histidine kinase inhibitor Sda [Aquibacillus koreensis]MDC3421775.1 sporulation histidine kinase inhibitor Sda [Aquibacillus koreensis]